MGQNAQGQFVIKAADSNSPSAMNTDEAHAWSRGVEHGVRETLACIELMLRGRHPDIVAEVKARVIIQGNDHDRSESA